MGILTKDDFRELAKIFATKDDIGILKSDVGKMKDDIGGLKSEVGTLKKDIEELKKNDEQILEAIAASMRELVHRAEFSNLQHRVTTLERKVS